MSKRPVVLNFSGHDCAGLAGIAMDIRTQTALGIHSMAVITANTAQNNTSVLSINPVAATVFSDQIQANTLLPMQAIKVGLIADQQQIPMIKDVVKNKAIPLVFDPVLKSSSGTEFVIDNGFIEALSNHLLPVCTLLTPNIAEAERLSGVSIRSVDDVVTASAQLLQGGVGAVLIKGGHLPLDGLLDDLTLAQDYFSDGKKSFWLSNDKVSSVNMRGTGCALSSAIASALALGYSLYDAVVIGKMAISQGIRHAYSLGNGEAGPINVTAFPDQQRDLPILSAKPVRIANQYRTSQCRISPSCERPLGLYPVVDRADWIKRLAPAGISTIQLRVKDLHGSALENEIQQAIHYAQQYDIRLFINDYWPLAIRYGAYGIHLGQEDLDSSDMQQIKAAGLRLGLSTHCHYEVARAHAYRPSYIACGPIYHTKTKDMPWVPQGVEGLSYWLRVLEYPLVAIGGINQQRFKGIAETGIGSIAMITAITLADNPVAVARQFVDILQQATGCSQAVGTSYSKAQKIQEGQS